MFGSVKRDLTIRICSEGTNWLLPGLWWWTEVGDDPHPLLHHHPCALVNSSGYTMADGFVAVCNFVDRITLAARDPRHITRHDEMSNAHCLLPPILYTSQLKGAIEEGFVK